MRGNVKRFIGMLVFASIVMIAASASAVLVTVDEIVFQNGGVNGAVLQGTADFSLVGGNLQIILTNTATGVTGGSSATNLLTGIGFVLPAGVTILNTAAQNSIVATPGSSVLGGSLTDSTWGAGDGPAALNNLTVLGDVNAVAGTLQAFIDFDLAGASGNVNGPNFGLLSSSVPSGTCGGLPCVQSSVTITLDLSSAPAGLIDSINAGHVVLAFGSPTPAVVPEPVSVVLIGTGLVVAGLLAWKRRSPTP